MDSHVVRSYGQISLQADARAHLGDSFHNHYYPIRVPLEDKYQVLYKSLSFTGMDSRLRNVEMASPGTCEWLRRHDCFTSWMDHAKLDQHNGLLWIKGKPGSGKSTIMKETLEWARHQWPDQMVLSYFFNARASDALERSCLGLYRSLTYQLLSAPQHQQLRSQFLLEFETKVREDLVEPWTTTELQNFFLRMIKFGYIPRLSVFIDALDEGDYDEIWGMIDFFQKANRISGLASSLRVCLASRHYPQIHYDIGLSVILEDQAGHVDDIAMYIESTLPGKHDDVMRDVQRSLVQRADGIFLWVVLTINLLKPLYCRGRIEQLKEQLYALPEGLHDLFVTIIRADLEDLDECVTLLQWMLVCQVPLSAGELWLAVQFRHPKPQLDLDLDQLDTSSTTATALKRIIDCSRGMVGPTHGSSGCMQLIHESVRQFLTSDFSRQKQTEVSVPLELDLTSEACHAAVAESCLNFLLHLCRKAPFNTYYYTECTLAPYASTFWWQHLRQVKGERRSKHAFDLAYELLGKPRNLTGWAQIYDVDRELYDPDPSFLTRKLYQPVYYAARIGLLLLFTDNLLQSADLNKKEGHFGTALQASCYRGSYEIVQILLDHDADPNVPGGDFGFALQTACAEGHAEVVSLLLRRGAHVNAQGGRYFNALVAASNLGYTDIVRRLLAYGATTRVMDGRHHSALCVAAASGHVDVVRLLLAAGADVNEQKKPSGGALYGACRQGHEEIVEILLESGADIDMQGGLLGTALFAATSEGHAGIVQKLVDKGALYDCSSPRLQARVEERPFW